MTGLREAAEAEFAKHSVGAFPGSPAQAIDCALQVAGVEIQRLQGENERLTREQDTDWVLQRVREALRCPPGRAITAIADAVYDWEPEVRDGWDTDVTGASEDRS